MVSRHPFSYATFFHHNQVGKLAGPHAGPPVVSVDKYNEQKTFQRLNLITRDSNSYDGGEHSNMTTFLSNNNLEHSLYRYE